MAQSNQQLPPQAPQNEIADAVRNAGTILILFLAFLATVAMAIVVLIDHELWPVMLAFAVLAWLVALATARIDLVPFLNANKMYSDLTRRFSSTIVDSTVK